jgi:hypothetical protein
MGQAVRYYSMPMACVTYICIQHLWRLLLLFPIPFAPSALSPQPTELIVTSLFFYSLQTYLTVQVFAMALICMAFVSHVYLPGI